MLGGKNPPCIIDLILRRICETLSHAVHGTLPYVAFGKELPAWYEWYQN
jgi:hypothetical protein